MLGRIAKTSVVSAPLVALMFFCFGNTGTEAQSGCPAYPAFPNASCTGYAPTGVTLTTYTGPNPVTVAGTVIDGKQINGNLTIQANNVTIRRSRILGGRIDTGGGSTYTGILIEDTEIDGANRSGTLFSCLGDGGFTGRRLNIHGCAQGIQASNFTLQDSYIHDLYGESDWHSEAILGKYSTATRPVRIIHNELQGIYNSSSTGGGMSSSVSFYTHGSFWGSQSAIWFEKNRLSTGESGLSQAWFCLYVGTDDPTNTLSNSTLVDNVFKRNASTGKCGKDPVTVDTNGGGGNCASNNRYEDGTAIPFGNLPACSTSSSTPAAPTGLRISKLLFNDFLLGLFVSPGRGSSHEQELVQRLPR